MSSPFIGQVIMFAGNYAPTGWAFCDGSTCPIAQNEELFFLLGTTYGGDGAETFGLPDLRGRIPIHQGQGTNLSSYTLGQTGGHETVRLTPQQMPEHTHTPMCFVGGTGQVTTPAGNIWTNEPSNQLYPYQNNPSDIDGQMYPSIIQSDGGDKAHSNMQPYLAISYCICLSGISPGIGPGSN